MFGRTATGKFIAVVYEVQHEDPLIIYPVTAYEVPEPGDERAGSDDA